MMNALFVAIKKLTGHGIIRTAAKHNHRELLAEVGANSAGRIDPNRTPLNYVLRGPNTAAEVADLERSLLEKAGITNIRKDAVRGLELVFSLPPATKIDHREYFEEVTKWTESYFGVPLLSSIVHLDEAAPHCHILLLPLVGGR